MAPAKNNEMEPQVLEARIKKKWQENHISSIVSIDGKPAMEKGENYCSVIMRYRLEIVYCSGEKSVKYFIIKKLPPSEAQEKFLQEFSFFRNEIHMYSKVLKGMKTLMAEFEDRRETLWCEMITYTPYDMIVLDDLQDQNFVMMNRKENLDFDHSMLVMRTLGRYHAMSKILLKRLLIYPNDFGSFLFSQPLLVNICFISSLTVLEEAVKKSWGDKWTHLPERLRKVKSQTQEKLSKLDPVDESRFNVLNHGDCWTNNMMFKHVEGTNTPCAVKYIDYQLSHYNSFAWDLTYFLYNSTRPDIRRAKYKELLTAYHQSLINNLKYFNYEENDTPTLDKVMEEMERLEFVGFLLLISIHVMTTADTTEAMDLEKILKNLDKPSEGINVDMFCSLKYRNCIEDDLHYFIKKGII
uniref:CHK kinase-like domain-containing protein n=3 Tax=Rhodnius prolixus TaxID=13249 RepID=A0A905QWS3_RHOPR